VDEFAVGIANSPAPPNVTTEGAMGFAEASADVFVYLGPPVFTAPGPPIGNTDVIDGNGLVPFGGPGTGLIEPNPPAGGSPFDEGDNLDAVDVDTTAADLFGPVFFSLDSRFVDPFEGAPANTGTASANGFVGGDVLVSSAGGAPALYAAAVTLGLDTAGVEDGDDLDALALFDDGELSPDGIPFFDPSVDAILFSVRRGSTIIGALDSMWGLPIEEGDVLTIPMVAGGAPAIFIPAEALGLATARSGMEEYGDELDALDVVPEPATLVLLAAGALGLLRRSWRF